MKRTALKLNDESILVKAIRTNTLPILLSEDIQIFDNLIETLFPAATLVSSDFLLVQEAVEAELVAQKLEPTPSFVVKIMQLYEAINTRNGVLIIGDAGLDFHLSH